MSDLPPLLDRLAARVTTELRSRLHGLFGAVIRAHLPQRWVIEAGPEVFTIVVAEDGGTTIETGRPERPDVTIRVEPDRLRRVLSGEDPRTIPGGRPSVAFGSVKGETAFTFLRRRFGL